MNFGEIPDCPTGTIKANRKELLAAAQRGASGTRRHGAGDRCARAVAAGWTGPRAGGRNAVVSPGWSGTGASTSYARTATLLVKADVEVAALERALTFDKYEAHARP